MSVWVIFAMWYSYLFSDILNMYGDMLVEAWFETIKIICVNWLVSDGNIRMKWMLKLWQYIIMCLKTLNKVECSSWGGLIYTFSVQMLGKQLWGNMIVLVARLSWKGHTLMSLGSLGSQFSLFKSPGKQTLSWYDSFSEKMVLKRPFICDLAEAFTHLMFRL